MIEITNQMCDDLEEATPLVELMLESTPSVQFCALVLTGLLLKETINSILSDDSEDRKLAVSDVFRNATMVAEALIKAGLVEVEDQPLPDNVYPLH